MGMRYQQLLWSRVKSFHQCLALLANDTLSVLLSIRFPVAPLHMSSASACRPSRPLNPCCPISGPLPRLLQRAARLVTDRAWTVTAATPPHALPAAFPSVDTLDPSLSALIQPLLFPSTVCHDAQPPSQGSSTVLPVADRLTLLSCGLLVTPTTIRVSTPAVVLALQALTARHNTRHPTSRLWRSCTLLSL